MKDLIEELRAGAELEEAYDADGIIRTGYQLSLRWRAAAEIERLRQQLTQRSARMQAMRAYLTSYSGPSTTLWRDFCRVRPEAAEWFDEDGVPR